MYKVLTKYKLRAVFIFCLVLIIASCSSSEQIVVDEPSLIMFSGFQDKNTNNVVDPGELLKQDESVYNAKEVFALIAPIDESSIEYRIYSRDEKRIIDSWNGEISNPKPVYLAAYNLPEGSYKLTVNLDDKRLYKFFWIDK